MPVATTVAVDPEGEVIRKRMPSSSMSTVWWCVRRRISPRSPTTTWPATGRALVSTLASLHAVDYASVGLESFGRPEGFAGRQVKLWARQWGHVKTRDLPISTPWWPRCRSGCPPKSRNTIVHGDFRVDNTILAKGDPGTTVRAVVDWEMSTLVTAALSTSR